MVKRLFNIHLSVVDEKTGVELRGALVWVTGTYAQRETNRLYWIDWSPTTATLPEQDLYFSAEHLEVTPEGSTIRYVGSWWVPSPWTTTSYAIEVRKVAGAPTWFYRDAKAGTLKIMYNGNKEICSVERVKELIKEGKAVYIFKEFPPTPPPAPETGVLDIKAYADSKEVQAKVVVNGRGPYTTPVSLELPAGTYSVKATYNDQTQTKTTTVVAGQTMKITFNFTLPPTPPPLTAISPYIILATGAIMFYLSSK